MLGSILDERAVPAVHGSILSPSLRSFSRGPPRGGGGSGGHGSSDSYEFRSSQSIWSTLVDLACIAAVVYLAKTGVHEPVVWSILSGLIMGRFGIAHAKTVERTRTGDGGGGWGDGGGGGGPRTETRTQWPPATPERDPASYPRAPAPAPRRDRDRDPRDPPIPREEAGSVAASDTDRSDGRTTMRGRLEVWIERRRSARRMVASSASVLSWSRWTSRGVTIPWTSVHLDVMSLAVILTLVGTLVVTGAVR